MWTSGVACLRGHTYVPGKAPPLNVTQDFGSYRVALCHPNRDDVVGQPAGILSICSEVILTNARRGLFRGCNIRPSATTSVSPSLSSTIPAPWITSCRCSDSLSILSSIDPSSDECSRDIVGKRCLRTNWTLSASWCGVFARSGLPTGVDVIASKSRPLSILAPC
jgi:hypothetical protein